MAETTLDDPEDWWMQVFTKKEGMDLNISMMNIIHEHENPDPYAFHVYCPPNLARDAIMGLVAILKNEEPSPEEMWAAHHIIELAIDGIYTRVFEDPNAPFDPEVEAAWDWVVMGIEDDDDEMEDDDDG